MRRVVPLPFPKDSLIRDAASLGAAIRAARTQTQMTRAQAAVALGISQDVLGDLERGRPTVAVGTVLRVATAFGVGLFAVRAEARERARSALMSLVP